MLSKKILCISGSTREGSTCVAILNTIAMKFSERANFEIYSRLDSMPHFDPDAEDSYLPEEVVHFRNAVENTDAVIICTPEYVFSLPAVLKNALEWSVASTVFSDKPTAMIVASTAGEKTFESLTLILKTIQAKLDDTCKLHLKGVRSKIQSDNALTDATMLQNIDGVVNALFSCMGKRIK